MRPGGTGRPDVTEPTGTPGDMRGLGGEGTSGSTGMPGGMEGGCMGGDGVAAVRTREASCEDERGSMQREIYRYQGDYRLGALRSQGR